MNNSAAVKSLLLLAAITFLSLNACGKMMSMDAGTAMAPTQVAEAPAVADRETAAGGSTPVLRQMLIRTAKVEIDSKDLERDLAKIVGRVAELQGFVASSSDDRRAETSRRAHLDVKVPADKLDAFLDFLKNEFKPDQISTNSEDVGEEYVDVESRLNNSRIEEKRLLEIIQNNTGKLEDVLMVEREIARVRESIETLEGRKRYLDNRISLSNVAIDISQDRPASDVQASWISELGHNLRETLVHSVETLGASLQSLILFIAAVLPWLVIIVPVWLILKRIRRNRKLKAKSRDSLSE